MQAPAQSTWVVVVGGANLDVKARSTAAIVAATSNPGTTTTSPGGVGRNIAENLARLGTRTHLVAVVGDDALGEEVLDATAVAGVDVDHVRRSARGTGTYTAVLDADGELVVAVADMGATAELAPEHLDAARDLIAGAALLVLDGNLAGPTLARALDLAASTGVPVVLDPVSVPKARALAPLLTRARPVLVVTPTLDELAALTGRSDLAAGVQVLRERGAAHVWVRLGVRGSLLSGPGGDTEMAAAPVAEVLDVTGAGDAMLAAFCHAWLAGEPGVDCARLGHAAAALTVAVPSTVRSDLTDDLLRSLQR